MLAGDEGFVDFDLALFDDGVDDNLITEAENKEVAFDDLVLVDLALFAISDHSGAFFGEEAHFVDGFFGADAVDDADKSVCDGNEDKEEVFVGANRDNHEGEDEVYEVENREGVFEDDFRDGVFGVFGRLVDLSLLDAGLDLLLC